MGLAQAEFWTERRGESLVPSLPVPIAKAGPLYFSLNSYTKMRGFSDATLAQAGRLLLPMMFNEAWDRFEAVEWGHCFHLIAQKLRTRRLSPVDLGWRPGVSFGFNAGGDMQNLTATPFARDDESREGGIFPADRPELVVHLVASLRRQNLVLGNTTLLLPCIAPAHGDPSPVADFLGIDGCWALPASVLCREIASRVQAFR